MRSGLTAVLSAYPGLVLRSALASRDFAVAADVVVWDAPESAGRGPAGNVLALVAEPEAARQALRAGARGALLRSTAPEAIAPAALAVAAGHWVLDARLVSALLPLGQRPGAIPTRLSPREAQVLSLLSEGLSNRELANRLGISRHTAKFHVNAILDKLGASTRTEAVVLAARGGLLRL